MKKMIFPNIEVYRQFFWSCNWYSRIGWDYFFIWKRQNRNHKLKCIISTISHSQNKTKFEFYLHLVFLVLLPIKFSTADDVQSYFWYIFSKLQKFIISFSDSLYCVVIFFDLMKTSIPLHILMEIMFYYVYLMIRSLIAVFWNYFAFHFITYIISAFYFNFCKISKAERVVIILEDKNENLYCTLTFMNISIYHYGWINCRSKIEARYIIWNFNRNEATISKLITLKTNHATEKAWMTFYPSTNCMMKAHNFLLFLSLLSFLAIFIATMKKIYCFLDAWWMNDVDAYLFFDILNFC
jgi:hypothetical protein